MHKPTSVIVQVGHYISETASIYLKQLADIGVLKAAAFNPRATRAALFRCD
jgi:hypothetical protein